MNPEEQQIAIAEACGWERGKHFEQILPTGEGETWDVWIKEGEEWCLDPPDYLNDINAMYEAENMLDSAPERFDRWTDFWDHLKAITCRTFDSDISDDCKAMLHATAAQRAEAFLRAIGKWRE